MRIRDNVRRIIGETVVAALEKGDREILVNASPFPGVHIKPAEKKGYWIESTEEPGFYDCSVCGEIQDWGHYKYCPNCGAKMEESE